MVTFKQWLEVVEYKITEGSDYLWKCYGPNAYRLESWNGTTNGHSSEIIFDRVTDTVYEVTVNDFKNNKAYRMINPLYVDLYREEATSMNVKPNDAWDDIEYIDLEVDFDFIEKAKAIFAGLSYDTRIQIELNLNDDEIFQLMKLAHKKDMTLNQYIEEVIEQEVEKK